MIKQVLAWGSAVALLLVVPGPAQAADLATTYAPLIYLSKGEAKRPANTGAFIAGSKLTWTHDGGCNDHELAPQGKVDAARLGNGGYQHQTANRICQHGTKYASNQNVRPYGPLGPREGMFLDLEDKQHGMGSVHSELYYDYVKGSHITYWFFYAFNDGPAVQNHEGDWERVSIRLDAANKPITVAYFSHGGACVLSYPSAKKSGTHPIAYAALGTHATYPKTGQFPTEFPGVKDNVIAGGEVWPTYLRTLRNVRSMPWYGYGGGWGNVGELTHTTGPIGPSAFKSPVPGNWSSPAC